MVMKPRNGNPREKQKGKHAGLAENDKSEPCGGGKGEKADIPAVSPLDRAIDTPSYQEHGMEATPGEEDPDDWAGRFYAEAEYPTIVRTAASTYKMLNRQLIGHDSDGKSPLMLLDSGSALTVDGD